MSESPSQEPASRAYAGYVLGVLFVVSIGALLSIPPAAGFLFAPGRYAALACYFVMIVLAAFYISPTYATTQGLAAPRMRALASAIILFVLNLIGLGLGPLVVGVLNDRLAPTWRRRHPRLDGLRLAGERVGRDPFALRQPHPTG